MAGAGGFADGLDGGGAGRAATGVAGVFVGGRAVFEASTGALDGTRTGATETTADADGAGLAAGVTGDTGGGAEFAGAVDGLAAVAEAGSGSGAWRSLSADATPGAERSVLHPTKPTPSTNAAARTPSATW